MANDTTIRGYNVLLIPSAECGWTALRQVLATLPAISAIDEAVSPNDAARLAAERLPDVVLTAARSGRESTVPILRLIRKDISPQSRIIVIGAAADMGEFMDVEVVSLAGYLLWSDLTIAMLPHVLTIVLDSEFIVISPQIAQELLEALRPPYEMCRMTETERCVLRRLAEGCTDKEIAALERVSARTIERIVAKFEAEYEVRSRFGLGWELGRRLDKRF